MEKLRVFVSSIQKELELERVAVAGWVSSDPNLSQHCDVILFEKEPLTGIRIRKPYLKCLDSCQVYLLILDCEYGNPPDFSATHEEYRYARDHDLPILVFIKGMTDHNRTEKTQAFLAEIKKDKNTYRRFYDRMDLKPEVEMALRSVLEIAFERQIAPPDEYAEGTLTEPASMFEQQSLDISADELDLTEAASWLRAIQAVDDSQPVEKRILFNNLRQKGLVRKEKDSYRVQASGLLFLGTDPSLRFPQCRIFADTFSSTATTSTPADQETLSAPAPVLVKEIWKFVQKNTRHPMRVIGLNRISLDEYPEEAVREAVVNAIAHRNYEDSTRQILVKLFSDRLEVLSPGEPLKPLTVAKIKQGNCQPCSRNPVLGQYLNHLRLMDQRGSGIGRMKDAMLNHGLDEPVYDLVQGYFRVTFNGPGENLERLKPPTGIGSFLSPAVEEQLNKRQKAVLQEVLKSGSVTSGWVVQSERVTYDTANRDLRGLAELNILERQGKGRATKYVLSEIKGRK